jgi:hypothetical protein
MSNTSLVVDQQTMKEHFIAIRYVHGSGGHFLNGLLTASKLNLPTFRLGEYGSGHYVYKEFNFYKNTMLFPDPTCDILTPPPYFVYTEHHSLETIANIFHKVINITYELDDCDEIELCFLGKFHLEEAENKINSTYCRHHTHRQKYYSPVDTTDNVLNITWKELLHGDHTILSKRLKLFTRLSNIKTDYLLEWREKTKLGMNKTQHIIVKNKDLIEV